MSLTPGSRRRDEDLNTVALQARVSPQTREAMKSMADASGLSLGLFFEELAKIIEVDQYGRPIGMPEFAEQEGFPIAI